MQITKPSCWHFVWILREILINILPATGEADPDSEEIESIASLLKVNIKWNEISQEDPFWIVELESDKEVHKITSRSVTLRYVIDLWGAANSVDELHQQLRSIPSSFMQPYTNIPFKMKVEVFGSSQSQKEKVERIESFSYLPLNGPVKLKDPELALQYIEFYGSQHLKVPEKPINVYFGRVVSEGQRDLISRHSLKKRKFIGNTSMDPQLSLIIANQAQIAPGDVVLDPFVGSGSLLIAAAEFGGYVFGTDIDFLMLHGKTRPTRKQDRDKPRKDESVQGNMKQYGLSQHYLDVIVADSSLPLWRPGIIFDAIIADPPYGMRESIEKIGTGKGSKKISDEHLPHHIPSKVGYSLSQLASDLLHFSACHLRLGGFLVFWIPIIRCEYDENKLPVHSCLELVANSEQTLSTTSSRRLLTYRKISEELEGPKKSVDESEESFRQRYYKYVEVLRKSRTDKYLEDQRKLKILQIQKSEEDKGKT